jgi:hypothetical protein
MKKTNTICAAIAAVLLSTTAYAETGTVKSVRLSSGGVAEYVRSLQVKDGVASIDVPTDQMDDFLKTLVVMSNVRLKGLSTTGPDMVAETFKTLPLQPGDLDSADGVLRALRGAAVSAGDRKGTIVGVEPSTEKRRARLIVLLADGSFDVAEIGGAMAYRLDDPEDNDMIRKAAALLADDRVAGSRKVSISVGDVDIDPEKPLPEARIDVSYVVAAPLWKPSYRIVVDGKGGARLQSWAVLENASGEDWKDVAISLTSGKPVTLKQRLYERAWTQREEVAVGRPEPIAQQARSLLGAKAEFAAAPAPMMAAPEQDAAVDEGDVVANFDLPGVYDLKNGETTSIPILDRKVEADFVALYKDGAEHPDAALVLRNATDVSLPAAVAAVYDEGGRYVGDAKVGNLKPGGAVTAIFAADQKIDQEAAVTTSRSFRSVTVKDGYLTASLEQRVRKTYSAWGADRDRKFVAEDRGMPGWTLVAADGVEATPEGARATVIVPSGRKSSVSIEWKMIEEQTQAVADLDDAVILQWLGEGPSPEIAEKLKAIVAARGDQKTTERELQSIEQSISETTNESVRVSGMLQSVGESPLRQQFLSDLGDQEKQIKELRARREQVRGKLEDLRRTLGEAIARL